MGFPIPSVETSGSCLTSVEPTVLGGLGFWVGDESGDLRFLVGEEEEELFLPAKRRALDIKASKAEGRVDMLE